MRLTGTKEASDPYTDFFSWGYQGLPVFAEKRPEGFDDLFRADVFLEFLPFLFFILIPDCDNALNGAGDVSCEQILNHCRFSFPQAGMLCNSYRHPGVQTA